jgi:hypothetical protein
LEMSRVHPTEIDLARLDGSSGGEAGREVADHLRWCARCRSVVADYRWLQGEVTAALASAADAVAVPRPRWWAVQEALSASQRRQVAGGRVSAVASVVLAVCLMLSASPVLSTAVAARALLPQVAMAPAPVTVAVSVERGVSLATPTPVVFCQDVTPVPTPAFVLPPTPPEPET